MIQWIALMHATLDVTRYLGSFRWVVSKGLFIFGEDVAATFGIDTMHARRGVDVALLADIVHPADRAAFSAATERASYYGGDIDIALRLVNMDQAEHIRLTGSCIRASRGRPVEFLGAIHSRADHGITSLSTIADHLCAAAEIARDLDEQPLRRFVHMALFELGTQLAKAEVDERKPQPNLAVVRSVR